MVTGNTADIQIILGSASAQAEITDLLGLTINGSADITNEAYLGQEVEAASVHAVMESYDFSNLYDSENTDAVTALLTTNLTDEASGLHLVVFQSGGLLQHWQGHPVSFAKPGYAAPPAESITRPWSMMQSGRGGFGTTVVPFTTTAGTELEILGASASRPDDPVLYLALTDVDGDVSEIELDDGSTEYNPSTAGITVYDLSATDQKLAITSTGGVCSGYAFVGERQKLAADAN